MAKNVFISFRYSDGIKYKNQLCSLFDGYYDTVDYSEDVNRSGCSEATIRDYLYRKLRKSSVTVILLTPGAINHHKDWYGQYDDWMYDEIRYSLENRAGNKTNGLIAVYTDEAKPYLIQNESDRVIVKDVDNLFRKNMMNVKPSYKTNPRLGYFDSDYDSYCSLVSFEQFTKNVGRYIDMAIEKRENLHKYELTRRM